MTQMFPLTLHQVLVRRSGKVVIGPTDLVLPPEGPTIIIGPNGSGKTTVLRVMHGIERVTSGTVTWQHDDPSQHAFVSDSLHGSFYGPPIAAVQLQADQGADGALLAV